MVDRHFESLSRYGASAMRISPTTGEPEDLLAEGGRLAVSFERLGRAPLLDVMRDPAVKGVVLADGSLTISADRDSRGVRFRVDHDGDLIVEQSIVVPSASGYRGPWFRPDPDSVEPDLVRAICEGDRPLFAVEGEEGVQWYSRGMHGSGLGALPMRGTVPVVLPEDLGSPSFRRDHGVKWAYVAGAMAGGIASPELVIALAREGLLAFFGAGGLPVAAVEQSLNQISEQVPEGAAWGANLLHNPNEPSVEEATVDLYLAYGVRRVSASAYMGLSDAIVRYRMTGIHRTAAGAVVVPNKVFAKVSRPEVAEVFMRPPSPATLQRLVDAGVLTTEQRDLAATVPVAEDITAEADSGGHTDRRPLLSLLPVLQQLRDRICQEEGYAARGGTVRVGAAGGLGTPGALWAAFAMGADYVLTGSVNQASVEAGTSDAAKALLAEAQYFDVATGPAPDMFELGAHVQVLSRGTMYAQRAQRLYDLYKRYDGLSAIPTAERAKIEKQLFRDDLDTVWERTRAYWNDRDAEQVRRAEADPRYQMALTFRWYLGMTSRWARTGDSARKRDFQVWCGPAMGAFNSWVAGTPLEALDQRDVATIARSLMNGAAAHARLTQARALGVSVPSFLAPQR